MGVVGRDELLRAYSRSELRRLDFVYKPGKGDSAALSMVIDAVEAANAIFDNDDEWRHGERIWVDVDGWIPAGLALSTDESAPLEFLQEWLDLFEATLTAAGATGRVVVRRPDRLPDFYDQLGRQPLQRQLTAFIAYSVLDRRPDIGGIPTWNVDAALRPVIAERFGRPPFAGARTFLDRPVHEYGPGSAPDQLARGLRGGSTRVWHLREDPPRAVTSGFFVNGSHGFMVYDPAQPWAERVEECRAALLALPHATDQAFIQYANSGANRWDYLEYGNPRPPYPDLAHWWRYRPDLITRFIPDPRGIMLLRDSHLDRAGDLSGWSVQPLGHGRHLVQAPDLAPWYAEAEPDPAVVAAARADFDALILTPEILEANPVPPS